MVRYLLRERSFFGYSTLVVPLLFVLDFLGTLCTLLVYFVVPSLFVELLLVQWDNGEKDDRIVTIVHYSSST